MSKAKKSVLQNQETPKEKTAVPLSPKEMKVLHFLENNFKKKGFCPTYQEIQNHFGFASINSVQNYMKQLMAKGYILVPPHQKRAIQILQSAESVKEQYLNSFSTKARSSSPQLLQAGGRTSPTPLIQLPIYGRVAAGQPLERFVHDEHFEVPPSLVRKPDSTYVLKVEGNSMIEDGIFDGDLILVEKTLQANNGDIVVATVENESTVKRYFLRKSGAREFLNKPVVELKPSNSSMKSLWYSPEQVHIQGHVIGLIRQFIY